MDLSIDCADWQTRHLFICSFVPKYFLILTYIVNGLFLTLSTAAYSLFSAISPLGERASCSYCVSSHEFPLDSVHQMSSDADSYSPPHVLHRLRSPLDFWLVYTLVVYEYVSSPPVCRVPFPFASSTKFSYKLVMVLSLHSSVLLGFED